MPKFTSSALSWLKCILKERFGHDFSLEYVNDGLTLGLSISDKFIYFDRLQEIFHKSDSNFPCYEWKPSSEGYDSPVDSTVYAPSEFELPAPLVEINEHGAIIHYDILGLTYWMLTRLEEIGSTNLDSHQRFPATSSHAYKHGYLERPIVDEWLNILGQVIKRVWCQIELKKHQFSLKISHDVDNPSAYGFKSWIKIGRIIISDILKRGDFKSFLIAPFIRFSMRDNLHSIDHCNTFDWLMDVSEANKLKSAFYFLSGISNKNYDGDYDLEHPAIRNLLRRIHERGHEIGLHPSYDTFLSPELIEKEAHRLKKICLEEGVKQTEWGGRMHYLRWKQPITMRAWDSAGMNYDSTLGYADRPGFRCGTCYEYLAFDPVTQEQLSLVIRPLVVMECTITEERYLGLGYGEEAEELFLTLKKRCQQVEGVFTLLWHNSMFYSIGARTLYQRILGSQDNGV